MVGKIGNVLNANTTKLMMAYSVRTIVFVSGLFTLAFGAAVIITAHLGVATWDVLHIGLADITGLSVGRLVQIVGIAMILGTCVLEKRWPSLGGVMNIILIGFFLNFILGFGIIPLNKGLAVRWAMMISGVVIMGIGSGMYVASKLGSGPRDGLTLYISRRFSISVAMSRTILEVMALIAGWLVGGPVALGTFISVFLIGPVMQTSLRFWTERLDGLSKINGYMTS